MRASILHMCRPPAWLQVIERTEAISTDPDDLPSFIDK
jgi:hypothetical protein